MPKSVPEPLEKFSVAYGAAAAVAGGVASVRVWGDVRKQDERNKGRLIHRQIPALA